MPAKHAIIENMDARWLNAQFDAHPEKTKATLAKALGLESPAISKILNGTRQIKAKEYHSMRQFFGLPVDGAHATAANSYVVDRLTGPQDILQDGGVKAETQWVIPAQIIQKHTDTASEHIKSFRVEDNMMAPDFRREEHVLVDLSDTTPSPPGTFVVSDGFGVMLRNCEIVHGSKPMEVKISALNNNFQSQTLALSGFKIMGRVIAKLQWL